MTFEEWYELNRFESDLHPKELMKQTWKSAYQQGYNDGVDSDYNPLTRDEHYK